jgi:myo-inositol-1(or 4)-monophosphatase
LRKSDDNAAAEGAELRALAPAFTAVVREAGGLARAAFGKPMKTWLKDRSSPVSEVDIAVDDLLRTKLAALVPDAGWLSEETEDAPARLSARRVLIVDPIDGTRAFIAGRPDWAVSAALVVAGRPVLAALYAPATEEFFFAIAGGGATRNGAPLRVSPGHGVAGARISGPKGLLDRLAAVAPPFQATERVYSLALRLARVADGTLDVAFAGRNSRDWDLAAADLLVHEAGGTLTSFGGVEIAYNREVPVHDALVAAGLARHRVVCALLREHGARLR